MEKSSAGPCVSQKSCGRDAFSMPDGCPQVRKPDIVNVVACDLPDLETPVFTISPIVADFPCTPIKVDTKVNGPGKIKGSAKWKRQGLCPRGEYNLDIEIPCVLNMPSSVDSTKHTISRTAGDGWYSAGLYKDDECGVNLYYDIQIPCDLNSIAITPGSDRVEVRKTPSSGCSYAATIDVPCQLPNISLHGGRNVSVSQSVAGCSFDATIDVGCPIGGVSINATGQASSSSSVTSGCGISATIDVPCQLNNVNVTVGFENELASEKARRAKNCETYGNGTGGLSPAADSLIDNLGNGGRLARDTYAKLVNNYRTGKASDLETEVLRQSGFSLGQNGKVSGNIGDIVSNMAGKSGVLAKNVSKSFCGQTSECSKDFDLELTCPVENFKLDVKVDNSVNEIGPKVYPETEAGQTKREKCSIEDFEIKIPKALGCAFDVFSPEAQSPKLVKIEEQETPPTIQARKTSSCMFDLEMTMPKALGCSFDIFKRTGDIPVTVSDSVNSSGPKMKVIPDNCRFDLEMTMPKALGCSFDILKEGDIPVTLVGSSSKPKIRVKKENCRFELEAEYPTPEHVDFGLEDNGDTLRLSRTSFGNQTHTVRFKNSCVSMSVPAFTVQYFKVENVGGQLVNKLYSYTVALECGMRMGKCSCSFKETGRNESETDSVIASLAKCEDKSD